MPSNSLSSRLLSCLPNLFTLSNGVCGFSALICAAVSLTGQYDAGNCLLWSISLVFAAMLFDGFDGKVARLTGSSSNLGAQLDSLCDAASFGVAPAFIMYLTCRAALSHTLLWFAAASYLCCAVLRLARFNVQTTDHSEEAHSWFRGLPSPAAAALVCGGCLPLQLWPSTFLLPCLAAALTVAAAALMISPLPVPHVSQVLRMLRGTRA